MRGEIATIRQKLNMNFIQLTRNKPSFLVFTFYTALLILVITLAACSETAVAPTEADYEIHLDTLSLLDTSRNRRIPLGIWDSEDGDAGVVIFNHGYGFNQGEDYLAYTYLTEYLAGQGFFVVSIQHELKTDSLLPLTGDPRVVRRPFWDAGVRNIRFVIDHLRSAYPEKELNEIYLIGHSHGGDMAALYPSIHPGTISKLITLDNVRMPLPRIENLPVLTLRSNDQPADEHVLPDGTEQKEFSIRIVKLKETGHNEMDDSGTEDQKAEIQQLILAFLKEK